MDDIINSEVNNMPSTDNVIKLFKKSKKASTELNKSNDDQITDLKDGHPSEVVGNGKVEAEQNVPLQMQLQYVNSLNMVDGIKKSISEFEQNCLKISKLAPAVDLDSFMKNFDMKKFEEFGLKNKCLQESNSDKPLRSEIARKHDEKVDLKKSEDVSDIRSLLKSCKVAINSLEKKLEDRAPKKYLSESPSESEEDQSSDSAYDPRHSKFDGDKSRKRRQYSKVSKAGRKSRGRPRKLIVDDRSSNSVPEIREKKFRGRPRKTVLYEDKSSSNGEPQVKKLRGRPRKNEVEENVNESSSVKDSNDNDKDSNDKESNDNDKESNAKQESDSNDSKEKEDSSNEKNTGDSTELSETQKDEVIVKKHKGRPRKYFNNEKEVKDKKPRGRPKSNLISEKDAPESSNNDSIAVRSRGRPKKNKNAENEQSNSTLN